MRELEEVTVNPSASKDGAEIADQRPFVIRGHHLQHYPHLLKWGSLNYNDPSGFARTMRKYVQNSTDQKYAKDVYGTSAEEANKVQSQHRQTLETFLALPDDYPVEIVEDALDSICGGCVIGDHCRRLFIKNHLKGSHTAKVDGLYLDSFLKNLDSLHLPKPTIIYEHAHFIDTEQSRQSRRIKTTAGVTKKIIKERELLSIPARILSLILRNI